MFLETEVDYIIELDLQEELLSIKSFVDDVKTGLGVEPIPELGDFYHSLVAISLGIAKIADINKFCPQVLRFLMNITRTASFWLTQAEIPFNRSLT